MLKIGMASATTLLVPRSVPTIATKLTADNTTSAIEHQSTSNLLWHIANIARLLEPWPQHVLRRCVTCVSSSKWPFEVTS